MFNFLFNNSFGRSFVKNNVIKNENVGAFIINLDDATARWNYVTKNAQKLGLPITRISAIDGRKMSQEKLDSFADKERYKNYFKMYPEPGTIGCSLSHGKAWEEFLKTDYEFALILEDDVAFNPNVLKNCISHAVKKRTYWDILSFEILHRGCPVPVCDLTSEHSMCVYLCNVTHAGCYLINKKAAEKLLNNLFPIVMGVDHYFTASWEFDIKFLGVEPRIVHQSFGNTQIKNFHSKKFNNISVRYKNANYLLHRAIIHFLYNLYLAVKLRKTKSTE